jgi:hypothetical protein
LIVTAMYLSLYLPKEKIKIENGFIKENSPFERK